MLNHIKKEIKTLNDEVSQFTDDVNSYELDIDRLNKGILKLIKLDEGHKFEINQLRTNLSDSLKVNELLNVKDKDYNTLKTEM